MIQGLNGLRGLAVFGVMLHHFGESNSFIYSLNLGHFGVMLFFVLSGFLITRIIIRQKQNNVKLFPFLKAFYLRRTLRIFPLYYLAILIFSFVGAGFGDRLFWHLCYASNFLLASEGSGFLGTHFWSLAVEEQFYLLYPIAIFTIPHKKTPLFLLTLLFIGLTGRLYAWEYAYDSNIDRMLWVNFDALVLGGILANAHFDKNRGGSFGIALPLLMVILGMTIGFALRNNILAIHFAMLAAFTLLIRYVRDNQDSLTTRILEIRPLRYIGLISYGLYVWHYLVWQNQDLFAPVQDWVNQLHPILQFGYSKVLIALTLSVFLSVISWHYFERPLLRFKKNFEYPT